MLLMQRWVETHSSYFMLYLVFSISPACLFLNHSPSLIQQTCKHLISVFSAPLQFYCQANFPRGHLASITSQTIHRQVMDLMLQQNWEYTYSWVWGLHYLDVSVCAHPVFFLHICVDTIFYSLLCQTGAHCPEDWLPEESVEDCLELLVVGTYDWKPTNHAVFSWKYIHIAYGEWKDSYGQYNDVYN